MKHHLAAVIVLAGLASAAALGQAGPARVRSVALPAPPRATADLANQSLPLPNAQPIHFVNVTAQVGINYTHHEAAPVPPLFDGQNTRFGTGCAIFDYNHDGFQDVYMPDSKGYPNILWRNNGNGTFTNVAEEAGFRARQAFANDVNGYGHMALAVDLNNDGWDDLVVLNDSDPFTTDFIGTQLYRNNGNGTFTNVTKGSGINTADPTMGGITAGDYDKDGDLDLFMGGWYDYNAYLYRNDGNFHFTNVTDAAHARVPRWRSHWTPIFADFDGDGWPDLFAAIDFEEDYFLRNNRDGTFTDDSVKAKTLHVFNDMGAAIADVDGDGDLDIYTTNVSAPGDCPTNNGCNMLYINDGKGVFSDGTKAAGVGYTGWSWGTWFFDAELDGDLDNLVATGWTQPFWQTPATLWVNDGTGKFTDQAAAAGINHTANSRGLAPFDYDNDGLIDFIVTDVLKKATVYHNQSVRQGAYLYVEAQGTVSNRNGVGSKVYVTAGGKTRFHEIMAGGSFYTSPMKEAHFGLGPVTKIDQLRVVFPSGREVIKTDLPVNQRVKVVEP